MHGKGYCPGNMTGMDGTGRTEASDAQRQPADFAINAKVRQVLARRWVVPERLEVGTTDGVVLLKGHVEREPTGAVTEDSDARSIFLRRLRTELKAIPGVVDVVMDAQEAERTDCR